MKVCLSIIIVLLVGCIFFGVAWQTEKEAREDRDRTIASLSGQKKALEKEIKKRNENVIELQRRNEELEALANADDFDWYADIGGSPVIVRLKSRVH